MLICNLFHFDGNNAGTERSDFFESDFVEVDNAVFPERAAVIDTNDDGLAVVGIGNANITPDGEPGVGRREGPGETIP